MTLPLTTDPEMEALLHRGAEEIARLNPHISAPAPQYTVEELARILRDDEEIEALWNTPEGQRAQRSSYTAADAVNEDRGE